MSDRERHTGDAGGEAGNCQERQGFDSEHVAWVLQKVRPKNIKRIGGKSQMMYDPWV